MSHTGLPRHWNAGPKFLDEGRVEDDHESCGGCGEPWPCRFEALVEALEEIKATSSSVPLGIPELVFREGQMRQVVGIAARALAAAQGGMP